jgi:hypothetical protein
VSSAADELDELGLGERELGAEPIEAPEGSELASLRDRVNKAKARKFDLQVADLDPPVFVRYRPVPAEALDKTHKRTEQLRKDRTVITNAIILADHCVGIFELDDGRTDEDGEPLKVSIDPEDRDGEWPKFGPRLAELLGQPMLKKAVDVVRAFYPFDGDVISTAQDLAIKSRYARDQIELEAEGN